VTLTTPHFDPKMLFFVEFYLGVPTKFGAFRLIVWQVNGKSNMHRPFWQWNWYCSAQYLLIYKYTGLWKPHIWTRRPHIAYSLYNFYGATITIKGRLYEGLPVWWAYILPNVAFLGLSFLELCRGKRQTDRQKDRQTDRQRSICNAPLSGWHNKVKSIIIHLFAQKPPWTNLHQIWHRASSSQRSHVCQFFIDRFKGFDSVRGQNFPFSIN